jgi:hypothetical protein
MRLSASAKACCQGHRAGRCSVHRRAVRVSRPGRASSRRRSVRAARTVWPGRPRTEVQRRRLCARQAMTVQAAFAKNLPDGKCASAWSLRSRIANSTTAWWRCSASTVARASVRFVTNGNSSQDGSSSPWRSRVRTRRTISRRPLSSVSAIGRCLSAGNRPASSRRTHRSARSPSGRPVGGERRSRTASRRGPAARTSRVTRTRSPRAAASARGARAPDPGDRLIAEARHATRSVRRAGPQPGCEGLRRCLRGSR